MELVLSSVLSEGLVPSLSFPMAEPAPDVHPNDELPPASTVGQPSLSTDADQREDRLSSITGPDTARAQCRKGRVTNL